MALTNAQVTACAGPEQIASVCIKDGTQMIHLQGPVPDWLVRLERTSGQPCQDTWDAIDQLMVTTPVRPDLLYMLGKQLMNRGCLSQALAVYQRVVTLEPAAAGYYLLSEVLQALGRVREALPWAQKAFAQAPDHPDYCARLAYCLFYGGDLQAGVDMMRRAHIQQPKNAGFLEQYVAWAHYLPGRSRDSFLSTYRALGTLLAKGAEVRRHHRNSPDPHRRLRLGVISPFFRDNSVAYTFEPFLDAYDRDRLEVFAYAHQGPAERDDSTERLRAKCDHFRFIWGMETQAVVALIQRDQIDILMEIGGYVRHHRFDVLACKPAPIQVDFGSVDTTGLTQMDYRFTDEVRDPRQWCQPYVETAVYLAGGCLCYRPIGAPGVVSELPARQNGHVTFGAFHDHLKLNASVLRLWARVLDAVDDARLIIKCAAVCDPGIHAHVLEQCRAAGLDSERIEILGWLPHGAHLALYDRVDLLLDTFPFNGAITTLEGLWMGVPTLTLTGDLWLGRTGHLILSRVGLEAFVAQTPQAYVDKALDFSRQWDALAQIRAGLRQTLLTSDLCDPHRFASEMTEALRYMWVRWCRAQGVTLSCEEPAGLFVRP